MFTMVACVGGVAFWIWKNAVWAANFEYHFLFISALQAKYAGLCVHFKSGNRKWLLSDPNKITQSLSECPVFFFLFIIN